ncbi:DUF1702 family protein [Thermostaphylospora chromogena]|uniref:DUF1702 family protein n=1 Tax=Thermostaphylospora chromogena TaxID=35622 RepID=UPI001F618FC3|nr:DUF1702 family protein [Thermostaphylospora chromogena]
MIRRILVPDVKETTVEKRGFWVKNAESTELLETIGEFFLAGYAYAVEARTPAAAEERLEEIPARFRGFAYEGAGMGFAVLDGLTFSGLRRVNAFLRGRGRVHNYMIYVGIGWAMARLPRFMWPKSELLDPVLLWLVHDGYGFHQAYFHTERYVHRQFRETSFSWPAGQEAYAARAIDQGIGRALWFVGGADVNRVTTLAERFPEERRADLYSGIGLAATYAGGVSEAELRLLRDRAGRYRPQLAQGSSFAAEARIRAGLLFPHTESAAQVICGTTAERAAQIARETRPDAAPSGRLPAYETWRRRIADTFVSHGGVTT